MLDLITYICTGCGHEFSEMQQPSRCPLCAAQGGCREFPSKATKTIAAQNDQFRFALLTGNFGNLIGSILQTPGVTEKGQEFMKACMFLVAAYDDFNEDNDPFADHGMGHIEVLGQNVWWKFDLYDLDRNQGSPEPENPTVTHRVLTIFLPSEY